MTKCDLIAPELLGFAVKIPPAHSRAKITGVFLHCVYHIKNRAFKNCDRNAERFGVVLQQSPVVVVISRIHHQKQQLKRDLPVPLKLLKQLRHEHGVLSARNAHGDPVFRLHEIILLHGGDKRRPELLMVFFDDAALDELPAFQFTTHGCNPL